jgi:hypothetical protein
VLRRVVGRFGLPERIVKGPRQDVIAIIGDRVVTAKFIHEDLEPGRTRFVVWSFATGARIGPAIELSGESDHEARIAGEEVLVRIHEVDHRKLRSTGIFAISTVDGSSRWLVGREPPDPDRPALVFAVSESGERFATAVCLASLEGRYGCARTEIRSVDDGALIRTVDTDGQVVRRFSRDWLVVGEYGFTGIVDPNDGMLWSDEGLDAVKFDDAKLVDGRFVTRAPNLDGSYRPKLASFNIRTGRYRVLFDPREGSRWMFLSDLSTSRYVVIAVSTGTGRWCHDCDPDHHWVLDAGVFDIETGIYDPDAIYLTIQP